MRHSNRDDLQKQAPQATQPVKVKQKTGLYNKLKMGCCFFFIVALIAGGLYLYKFYQDVRAQIDIEVNRDKEVYEETKQTIERVNENYKKFDSAVEQGKEYLNKAEDLKDEIDN